MSKISYSNCTILDNWVFDNFRLVDKPFAINLLNLETCVSVNNNLCGNSVSSLESPVTVNERFKFTSVPLFIPIFNSRFFECYHMC